MIGHVAPSRPAYYDRNPVGKNQTYAVAGVAPHASVARWTYTVPTGKKAFNQSIYAGVDRATAAAPMGKANAGAAFTPNGDVKAVVFEAVLHNNTVGAEKSGQLAGVGLMDAGGVLSGETSDASTAGTINYRLTATIFEFDA